MKAYLQLLLIYLVSIGCEIDPVSPGAGIPEMERELRSGSSADSHLADSLIAAYQNHWQSNPGDSLSPYYLMRAADLLKEEPGRELKAINLYNQIGLEYPDHPLVPGSILMIGYVFDEKLNDRERAKKTYSYLINTFPNHTLAGEARNLLTLISDTLSDEEIVARWLDAKKNDTLNKKE